MVGKPCKTLESPLGFGGDQQRQLIMLRLVELCLLLLDTVTLAIMAETNGQRASKCRQIGKTVTNTVAAR